MTQLRLAYSSSNPRTPTSAPPSQKLRMSRAGWSRLPRLAQKAVLLENHDPAAARVIEMLVDDALNQDD